MKLNGTIAHPDLINIKIEVSSDDTTYVTAVDKTSNTTLGNSTDVFTATGTFVRVTVTGCSAAGAYSSAYEIKVYGTSTGTVTPTPITTIIPPTPTGSGFTFQLKNGTRGNYPDSQIYWCILGTDPVTGKGSYLDINGNWVAYTLATNDDPGHLTKNGKNYANIYHTISDTVSVPLPNVTSGRMYLSVGSPMYIKLLDKGYAGADINNPTDPNNDVYWDFIQFTVNNTGYHGNTTRVDAFGFPITHQLICYDGYNKIVGETETRDALFTEYLNEVPAEFKTLVSAPYRILAPCKGGFKTGRPYANYFDSYINQVWTGATKPTTQDVFLGTNLLGQDARSCGALNRHIYEDPAHWSDPTYFYKATPCNYYSAFWHVHSIDHLSYGFCYDDTEGQAAYLEHNNPQSLIVTIGW